MANKKVTELTATAEVVDADLFHVVKNVATSPINRKITKANLVSALGIAKITISATEPASPVLNEIWIDTSG